ncbi:MAG TPA: sigma-70 family RNA polymerase sigma factor [Isosphaeraceae bacterium]|jgi:RNA polymerase sigma-70 factor (ECF subfamily)
MQAPETPIQPSPDESEGAALLAGLLSGDRAAFEILVRQQGGRMVATARRLLLNDEDARDAVQDAFLAAVRSIDRFDGASRLSTWLHRIVINAALMKLRARRREHERPIEDLLPSFRPTGDHPGPVLPWAEPCDVAVQRRETRDLVHAAIARLPEDYRVVLLLRDIEGLDTKETAGVLGISADAVKTRLRRAHQALRSLLDPHLRGEAP